MTIVFYSPRFYPLLGGLERVVAQWADYLSGLGENIIIITETPHALSDETPYAVYRNCPLWRQWQLMRQADVVVQFNMSLKGLPVWWLSRKPLIISHHTLLLNTPGKTPFRQQLKLWCSNWLPDLNFACSSFVARQFKTCSVIFSPYQSDLFYVQSLERPPGTIIFVGRLVSDKGADLLIKAMQLLKQRQISCTLNVVGAGPELTALEQMTGQLSLQQEINFLGKKEGTALATLLNQHQIMVVPSRVEPFGITVLEGLACGCNLLISNAGGLPEAAAGMAKIFMSGNVNDLALKLEELLLNQHHSASVGKPQHLPACTIEATGALLLKNCQTVVNA